MENPPTPNRDLLQRRTTLRDIAERTGLSINTVSAVLNPRSRPIYISAGTRTKVEQAARELNYTRNVAASRLAGGRSRLLGALVLNPEDPLESSLLCSFESAAAERGYQCLVCCGGGSGPISRCAKALRHFGEHNAEGLFISMLDGTPEAHDGLAAMLARGLPAVLVNAETREINAPVVCANDHLGGQLLARHLIDQGHRSFLFLATEHQMHLRGVREMIDGAQNILEQNGFKPPFDGMTVPLGAPQTVAQPLVERLRAGKAPSVVICSSDALAVRLIIGLREAGLSVPGDLAVTGYGDLAYAWRAGEPRDGPEWPWDPGLTTIRIPAGKIGAAAANTLIDQLEGTWTGSPARQVFPVELVIAGSSELAQRN